MLRDLAVLQGEGSLYVFLMKQGARLSPFEEEWRTSACLLKGCQYQVWLHLELKDGLVRIHADSDSLISRGLMSLWVRLFSGLTPGEVLAADTEVLRQGVLGTWLIPSRANALGNMASRIKLGVLRLRQEERRMPVSCLSAVHGEAGRQGPLKGLVPAGNSCHDGRELEEISPQ